MSAAPGQTVGPFFHLGLPYEKGAELVPPGRAGAIRLHGTVYDGDGVPVPDALIEIWQANAAGRYNHPADRQAGELDPEFRGWSRTGTNFETGIFTFETIKPGRVVGRNGSTMAPHVSFWIVSRGINIGLNTRMYFDDETAANGEDPVLRMIEPQVRRQTLLAKRGERDGKVVYTFDIYLQGPNETVFLDV